MGVVGNAVEAYVRTYTTLFNSSGSNSNSISEDFLSQYLDYRIAKDPAKRLLIGKWETGMYEASLFAYLNYVG